MKRRGFIGALLAVIAAPRALFGKAVRSVVCPVEISKTYSFSCISFVDTRTGRETLPDGTVVNPGTSPSGKIFSDGAQVGGWQRASYPDINSKGADAAHPARALTHQ